MRLSYAIVGLCIAMLVAFLFIAKGNHGTIVALSVTDVSNGVTGMVIRNLEIGKSSEVPKENVSITARQDE